MIRLALLAAVPVAPALHYPLAPSPIWVFLSGLVGIGVLADWIHAATEQLARHTGPAVGGLLSVSLGSVAELILAIFVLLQGTPEVVDTRSPIAPRLPVPAVPDSADPRPFLQDAQAALDSRRTGKAQEALERAETRALDRTTAPDAAATPDGTPMIQQIAAAREALARGNVGEAHNILADLLGGAPATMAANPAPSVPTSAPASPPTSATPVAMTTGTASAAAGAATGTQWPAIATNADGIPGANFGQDGTPIYVQPDGALVTYGTPLK